MEQLASNAKVIREFLDAGSTRKVETHDYMLFWQSLTPEEKQSFGDGARSLMVTHSQASTPPLNLNFRRTRIKSLQTYTLGAFSICERFL